MRLTYLGRYAALLGIGAAALALGGCVQQAATSWQRFDGQSVHASPALEQQAAVDLATCRAAAINAGNQVPMPAGSQRTTVNNNVNVTVPVYTDARRTDFPSGVNAPAAPSYVSPQMDFSPLADAGATYGARVRQAQTESANLQECMSQRGYRAAPSS